MKLLRALFASLFAMLLMAVSSVYAAVPTEVSTAITDMKADALTVASAFLVALIAVIAFLFMRKGAK